MSSAHDHTTFGTTARTLSPFDEAAARCPLLGEQQKQQQQQQQSSPRKWTLFGPNRSSPTTTIMLSTEYRNHGSGVETIDFINLNDRSDEHAYDNDSDEEMQTIFARLPSGMRPAAARGNSSPLIQLCEIRKGTYASTYDFHFTQVCQSCACDDGCRYSRRGL
jgi:hypothetical protein